MLAFTRCCCWVESMYVELKLFVLVTGDHIRSVLSVLDVMNESTGRLESVDVVDDVVVVVVGLNVSTAKQHELWKRCESSFFTRVKSLKLIFNTLYHLYFS